MGLKLHYLDLSTLPRIHDIVWCCLPDTDTGQPGSTVRPALVRGTLRDPTTKRGAVRVSYGSVRLDFADTHHVDLIIQNAARLAELELPMAVRFDLGIENQLPWAAEFFQPPEHSIYVTAGRLTEPEIQLLRSKLKNRGIILAM